MSFDFFTGLRPSEEIALTVADLDLARGTLGVCKARVAGIDRNSTKTGEDRTITLCPRVLDVAKRQLSSRAQLMLEGEDLSLRRFHSFETVISELAAFIVPSDNRSSRSSTEGRYGLGVLPQRR
jgi:integrase